MFVTVVQIRIHLPWVHSHKEHRSEAKSLIRRLRNRYNAAVCETGDPERRQMLELGVAYWSPDRAGADRTAQSVGDEVSRLTEGEVLAVTIARMVESCE